MGMAVMALKRDALDAIFSKLVRQRSGWTCEACHINLEHETVNCHCAHIIGRRITRLRHDPRNAMTLCASCHFYYTDRPMEWTAFVRKECGDSVMDELIRLSNESCKFPKGWKKEALAHYKSEEKRLAAARAENYTGRFEFVGYW